MHEGLNLGMVIRRLADEDPLLVMPIGFFNPHSYRGYYEELAFEPVLSIEIADVFAEATKAVETTFEGHKGGDYVMREATPVWLAEEGCTGERLTPLWLELLLALAKSETVARAQPLPEWFETRTGE